MPPPVVHLFGRPNKIRKNINVKVSHYTLSSIHQLLPLMYTLSHFVHKPLNRTLPLHRAVRRDI